MQNMKLLEDIFDEPPHSDLRKHLYGKAIDSPGPYSRARMDLAQEMGAPVKPIWLRIKSATRAKRMMEIDNAYVIYIYDNTNIHCHLINGVIECSDDEREKWNMFSASLYRNSAKNMLRHKDEVANELATKINNYLALTKSKEESQEDQEVLKKATGSPLRNALKGLF